MKAWKTPEASGEVELNKLHQNAHTTASNPKLRFPAENFLFQGRTWRIFKRTAGRNAAWYFLLQRDGGRHLTSLRTPSKPAAVEKAKLLIEAASQRKLGEMRAVLAGRPEQKQLFGTVDEYLDLYERTPTGENSPRSRHHFVLAFRRLMSRVANPPARMDELESLFRQVRAKADGDLEAAQDNSAALRIKRSFSSEVANAASVISERAVFVLKQQLVLPDFSELRQMIKHHVRYPSAKKTVDEYRPPSQAVLDATIAGWLKLSKNEFLAVGLALCCGMRLSEIRGKYDPLKAVWKGAASWDWFREHNGYLWCDGTGSFKDGTPVIRAQVLDPFWKLLHERIRNENWSQEGLIITGNRSEFDKNISRWMKSLGWETRLHLHALRAWAGSLVFMRYGESAACSFCRHSEPAVTRQSYGWLRQSWHVENSAVKVAEKPVVWVTSNG